MFFFGSTIYAPPIVPTLSVVLGNGNQGSGIQVKNIGDPTLPQDAVTLSYLQSSLANSVGFEQNFLLMGG